METHSSTPHAAARMIAALLRFVCVLALLGLAGGCATRTLPNGCVVSAARYDQVMAACELVPRKGHHGILVARFIGQRLSRTVCVFEYNRQLWVYDPVDGSRVVSERERPAWRDPMHLARLIFRNERVLYAMWVTEETTRSGQR